MFTFPPANQFRVKFYSKEVTLTKFCDKFVVVDSEIFTAVWLTKHNAQSVEKRENVHTRTEKLFRQINYLVTSLEKTLLSRNFCEKSMRVKFRNLQHCGVLCTL